MRGPVNGDERGVDVIDELVGPRDTPAIVMTVTRSMRALAGWPRAAFWSDQRGRARTPWLILLPLLGAMLTMAIADAATSDRLPLPQAQLVVSAAAAGAAIALILLSRRFLGAPRGLSEYGLALDGRWMRDAVAGVVVGVVGVSIPFLVGIGAGWIDVAAVFDRGAVALWPGILLYGIAMLFTGLWEELVLRGVFLCNAADGLRRWLSARRAVAGALILSGVVFGLGHLGQAVHPALIVTWILPGILFGILFVLSGSLALPIGAHVAFNTTANVLFARTDVADLNELSALMRIDVDPSLTLLTHGGALEATAFVVVGMLSLLWIRLSRGVVTVDLDALNLEERDAPQHNVVRILEATDEAGTLDGWPSTR